MNQNQIPKEMIDKIEQRVMERLFIEEVKETNILREYDAMFRELGYMGLTWIGEYGEYTLEDKTEE